jgi:hypothetical protein
MLTTVAEEDWTIVLKIFEVTLSGRGDRGRVDRKFLDTPHYFVIGS